MSHPFAHAERSARRWGGAAKDYLAVHAWFDATKAHVPDSRHRMVLHNAFGLSLAEQVFGTHLVNSAGRRVFVRQIGQQHVLEDLGRIPSLAECLCDLPLRLWMGGALRDLAGAGQDGCESPHRRSSSELNGSRRPDHG